MFWYAFVSSSDSNRYDGNSIFFRTDDGSLLSPCLDSVNIDFDQIADIHQLDGPAAYLISPASDYFSKGTLCLGLVVYIPDSYGMNASYGLAIDDYPPDAIYLDIVGKDFQVVAKIEPKFVSVPVSQKGKVYMIEPKSNQTLFFADWSTPRDSQAFYQNPESKIWVPYDCRYRPISYSEFSSCLSKRKALLHIYGDSNIRRALKALTTGGAWCNNSSSWNCQCSDQGRDPVPYFNDGNDVNYFAKVAGSEGFSIFYERVAGFFSQQGPFDHILNISHIAESLSKVGMNEYHTPTAVIFNLVNWDAGFFKWEDFKTNVLKIVEAMNTTYHEIPLFIRPG